MQEFLSRSLNRENVVRGTLLFVVFTFAGLFVSFLWSGGQDIKRVFREMQTEMLLGACLCMFVDWLFGALRFHIFIRKVTPTIRFRDSIRANLATLCVSAITPFQTGGVGHLYIYARTGVPLSGAITSGLICFFATLVTLILGAGTILWLDPPFLPKEATWASLFSFLTFGLVFTLFILLLFKPEIVFRFFYWLCAAAQRRFTRLAPLLERATLKVEQLTAEHKTFATMFLRDHKWTCALSVPLTCGFIGARIVGSYIVAQALNGDTTLWELCVTGLVLNFVVLFAPSPGASGVAEVVTVRLMENLISKELIPLFVLLTRFFSIYCAVLVGGIIIGTQVTKDFKKNK
ncbi:flippase-like domain-containing protein [Candidatus Poribacteria bacterium]|nr:flippase-like domain-containing protein [Candidatus Poribacteria bacterium]MYG08340.1 flippase-like domain-containing protein [Candidatus Poribacteria bacterium]MYK24189.1 flippase-like domain-containing protein [Candidatus Poribacteria bacterium]